ncbi:hypothetical protein [Aquipuribacter sp. SD81]|uniref:hypothetical protein n=1 Tax=Aquipuribacter sp. SD81 TaxID=3127703 RepID=UPI00301A8D27
MAAATTGGEGRPQGTAERDRLLARYRALTREDLPRAARAGGWVVTEDHCFGRILLDHAVGGRWYDVLDRRRSPAFAQLDDAQLAGAVALAEQVLAEGDALLRELDARSLRWRGHWPKRAVRPAGVVRPGGDDEISG